MLSQCCVVVSTVVCVTVVCVWDPYLTVCCTVRVALTVYATVVPQYFASVICILCFVNCGTIPSVRVLPCAVGFGTGTFAIQSASLPRCTRLFRILWYIAIHVHRDYGVDTARDLTLLTPFLVKLHRSFSRTARRSWCLKFPCASSSSSSSSNQSVAAHLDLSSYGLRLAFTSAHALLNSCVPSLHPSPSVRCHWTWLL